jgi:uncharacterized membrane-anchored protein
MNTVPDQLARALQACTANGVLPPDAAVQAQDHRPWPITLLTALGAWLSAVPLIGVVYLLLGDMLTNSLGPYLAGVLMLAGAVVVLRSRAIPIFVEQLAVPALLVGGAALSFGLFRDASTPVAAACLAALALGLAIAIPQPWLRVLLGSAAALAVVVAMVPERVFKSPDTPFFVLWLALQAALLIWLAALVLQHSNIALRRSTRMAAMIEAVSAGWLLLVLCGLCWWSGMTFMVSGSLGGGLWGDLAQPQGTSALKNTVWQLSQAGSLVMAVAATLVIARAWPALRQWPVAVAALALCVLSWLLPALGAALLALAWTATSQRWRLAAACTVATAWIVGSFYYQLSWSLADKAALMVALAAIIGASTWWAAHSKVKAQPPAAATQGKQVAVWMLLGAALTLAVANFSIWQKENLIATGQKVFVELAPADPRSLMQGDFMRLNYGLLNNAASLAPVSGLTAQRPHMVVRLDARGVAQGVRAGQNDTPLATGEMRIELTPKDGRWTVVSDAWFFREGDAKRWEAAKYGEFRVTPDGRALLVGLADAQLKSISVKP